MNNESEKSEGLAERIGGKLKSAIGKTVGDEQMQAEGEAKELKGAAHEESAKAAERARGAAEETAGAVKNRFGAVVDDEQMQAEGKLKELKGQARIKANE